MSKRIIIHNHFPVRDEAKYTHEEVKYGPGKADHCSICAHFTSSNPPTCSLVRDVKPDGWCMLFKRGTGV